MEKLVKKVVVIAMVFVMILSLTPLTAMAETTVNKGPVFITQSDNMTCTVAANTTQEFVITGSATVNAKYRITLTPNNQAAETAEITISHLNMRNEFISSSTSVGGGSNIITCYLGGFVGFLVENPSASEVSYTVTMGQVYVDSPVVDNTFKMEPQWIYKGDSCTWNLSFPKVEASSTVVYIVSVYKDDIQLGGARISDDSDNMDEDAIVYDMSSWVDGSGKYHAVVEVEGHGIKGTSDVATYVDPGKKIETPEISFSKDGVITFNVVEGAAYYELVVFYMSVVNGDSDYDNGYTLYPTDSKDGKVISLDYSEVYADVDDWDADFVACVTAYSDDINVIKSSYVSKDSNVWELRMSKDKAEEKVDAALESRDSEEVKTALESIANETVIEIMKEDITKIKEAEDKRAEDNGITVETKSEVESVDASKISIVGAAFNANGINEKEVVLSVKEPEKKVEVDKKYENAVALDIKLLVAGEARENLSVPVAITMPIPEGVEKENLVILHYHGDTEEPVVIVPTVNADGTMSFYVDGFSTFVIANQAKEGITSDDLDDSNDSNDSNNSDDSNESKPEGDDITTPDDSNGSKPGNDNITTPDDSGDSITSESGDDSTTTPETPKTSKSPKTGDDSTTIFVCSLLLLMVGVVLVVKRNAIVR